MCYVVFYLFVAFNHVLELSDFPSFTEQDAFVLSCRSTQKHQGTYINYKSNLDIQLSAGNTFLEYPSPATLKIKRFESQIIKKIFVEARTIKGSKQNKQKP